MKVAPGPSSVWAQTAHAQTYSPTGTELGHTDLMVSVPWPIPQSLSCDPLAGKTLTGIPSCPDLAIQPAHHPRTHVALAGPVCHHTCQTGEVLLTWDETVGHKHENRWDRQSHLKTSCTSAGFPCGLPDSHFGDWQMVPRGMSEWPILTWSPPFPGRGRMSFPCNTS